MLDRLIWEQVCSMGVMPWPLTKMIMQVVDRSLLIVGGFVDKFTNDILIFDLSKTYYRVYIKILKM